MLFPDMEAVEAIAGFTEAGDTVSGYTTNEAIQSLFGDIVTSTPVSPEQFSAIIARCETSNWLSWKATWQMWLDQGLLN